MPLVKIWRDPKLVDDARAIKIRDKLQGIVAGYLKVGPQEVEVRVHDIGHLDINYAPIGIEVDTGPGKERWRVAERAVLVKKIAQRLAQVKVIPADWLGPDKSYIWIRICESAFVPIGFPDHAR